jgi:hypothetical protein
MQEVSNSISISNSEGVSSRIIKEEGKEQDSKEKLQ